MRTRFIVTLSTLALGSAAFAGTLNFQNVTATRIDQNVAEQASNEKEVEFGDFDNDNDLDVVVAVGYSDFGTRKNKLYRNDVGVFNEISGAPVISGFSTGDVTRNAFFRDYNKDGWLDIIVVNDANTGGDGGRTKIYINQHPGNVFSHFTEEGNARLGPSTGGAACGGFSADFDNDDDDDLYVGNYPGPSQDTMYFNNANGFFTGVTASNVPSDGDYTVDVASADLNGDGRLDLLLSSHGVNELYYNNLNNLGTGVGDYSYTGSIQTLQASVRSENSMEPADFDNDGRVDIYRSDMTGAGGMEDRIMQNTGNDANGKAVFTLLPVAVLPPSATAAASMKATIADLNQDGRVDVVVMKENGSGSGGRPTILRNTSVGGAISFVDWTPAPAFPTGNAHVGWHAGVADTNNDGDLDIFVGGWNNDFLFEQVPGTEVNESDLSGGNLPALFNSAPVAVTGSAPVGRPDSFTLSSIGANALISLVLSGPDDYKLEVLDGANVLATSDRGGLGVEEALQLNAQTGTRIIRVTVLARASTPEDIAPVGAPDGSVGPADLGQLLASWGQCPAKGDCPADIAPVGSPDGAVGPADLGQLLSKWGPVTDNLYVLEVLSRN